MDTLGIKKMVLIYLVQRPLSFKRNLAWDYNSFNFRDRMYYGYMHAESHLRPDPDIVHAEVVITFIVSTR